MNNRQWETRNKRKKRNRPIFLALSYEKSREKVRKKPEQLSMAPYFVGYFVQLTKYASKQVQ
jgi:hypothetical protein